MKTISKKIITMLVGAFISIITFSSCTDKEDVHISYDSTLTVSAAHIFDTYRSTVDGDFALSGVAGEWKLNLHTYIYNVNGELVDMEEGSFNSLTSQLTHKLTLDPGKYTIVSIADFEGTHGNQFCRFWNISNTKSLKDFTIQESETVFSSAMETLGVDVKEIEISDRAQSVDIDIKPVTGLLEIIVWDDDFSGIGKDGYSYNAPYINDLTIYPQQLKQIVKFEDNKPVYEYGIQAVRTPIHAHYPKNHVATGGSKQTLAYRALLPDNNKKFFWELNAVKGAGKLLFKDGNDFQSSDLTDNTIDVESGKQYVMDLLLDAFYLFVEDYDPSVDMFDRLQKHMNYLNYMNLTKPLKNQYDKLVGSSKQQIESYLELTEFSKSGNQINYFGEGLVSFVSVLFEDETFSKSTRIMLIWNINSRESYDTVAKALSEMYTPWDKGSTDAVKQYINAKSIDDATVRITWAINKNNNGTNYCLYFDAIKR